MVDYSPNSTANIYIDLSVDGEGVAGASVTVAVRDPDGLLVIPAGVPTDQGGGLYLYQVSSGLTGKIGTYFVTWSVTAPFIQTLATSFTVGYEGTYPTTFLEIRHAVARLVQGKEGFVTGQVASATSTSLSDLERLEADSALRGWQLHVYNGTAQGQSRRVVASTSQGVLTVGRAFTVTPAVGDLYECHRYFDAEELNQVIRQAIEEVQEEVFCPISDSQLTLGSSTYEYAIPAGFSHVHAVDVEVVTGLWEEITPAAWRVLMATRRVKIDSDIVGAYSGRRLRLRGFRQATVPLSDDATLDVRPAFIRHRAAALLCEQLLGGRASDSEGWATKFQVNEARAEAERRRIRRRLPPNTRRVE